MAEPEDAVVPILRNIQADLGQLEREISNGFAEVRSHFEQLAERMDAFEGYFTYTMGVSSQNKVDIEQLQTEIKDIKRRLEELERQS